MRFIICTYFHEQLSHNPHFMPCLEQVVFKVAIKDTVPTISRPVSLTQADTTGKAPLRRGGSGSGPGKKSPGRARAESPRASSPRAAPLVGPPKPESSGSLEPKPQPPPDATYELLPSAPTFGGSGSTPHSTLPRSSHRISSPLRHNTTTPVTTLTTIILSSNHRPSPLPIHHLTTHHLRYLGAWCHTLSRTCAPAAVRVNGS